MIHIFLDHTIKSFKATPKDLCECGSSCGLCRDQQESLRHFQEKEEDLGEEYSRAFDDIFSDPLDQLDEI